MQSLCDTFLSIDTMVTSNKLTVQLGEFWGASEKDMPYRPRLSDYVLSNSLIGEKFMMNE